jgi:hypothetical protein
MRNHVLGFFLETPAKENQMQHFNIKYYSRGEDSKWQSVHDNLVITYLQDLENAMRDKYRDGSRRTYVTKIPQLPISFHALLMDDGKRWDCINGFT